MNKSTETKETNVYNFSLASDGGDRSSRIRWGPFLRPWLHKALLNLGSGRTSLLPSCFSANALRDLTAEGARFLKELKAKRQTSDFFENKKVLSVNVFMEGIVLLRIIKSARADCRVEYPLGFSVLNNEWSNYDWRSPLLWNARSSIKNCSNAVLRLLWWPFLLHCFMIDAPIIVSAWKSSENCSVKTLK